MLFCGYLALSCRTLPCLGLPCLALPCLAVPRLALPCLAQLARPAFFMASPQQLCYQPHHLAHSIFIYALCTAHDFAKKTSLPKKSIKSNLLSLWPTNVLDSEHVVFLVILPCLVTPCLVFAWFLPSRQKH